jgi:hypothetical protein
VSATASIAVTSVRCSEFAMLICALIILSPRQLLVAMAENAFPV